MACSRSLGDLIIHNTERYHKINGKYAALHTLYLINYNIKFYTEEIQQPGHVTAYYHHKLTFHQEGPVPAQRGQDQRDSESA